MWIDQPAGVGFSYQSSADSVTDSEDQVAEDIYQFLQSFFTANPQFTNNDFYVFGESYGGCRQGCRGEGRKRTKRQEDGERNLPTPFPF